jgi:hypothetical protein
MEFDFGHDARGRNGCLRADKIDGVEYLCIGFYNFLKDGLPTPLL